MAPRRKQRDEDDLDDDMDDEELEGAQRSKKRKAPRFIDDAAEVDEDDEDEEGGGAGRQKKKKKSIYIDDIADVDDDEEEEEDDDEAEDIIDDHDVEIPEENAAANHANYRQLREREERSAEEIAAAFLEKHRRLQEDGYEDATAFAETGAVGRQAMQPTIHDPKLWLVNCRPGHEREVVTQLLQKCYAMHRAGTALSIKSAVALDHLKGYVYIEAVKEAHVREAIKGLRTIFVSKGVKLVPLEQMVEAITVNRQAKQAIERGTWVRVRSGLYKDDLAKVVEVDNASQKATIQLIPRVDFQAMAQKARDDEQGTGEGRKRNPFHRGPVRPPARPFNAEEARQLGLIVTSTTGYDGVTYLQVADSSQRYVNGYLERDVAFKGLNVIEGVPPLEEMQRYNAVAASAEAGSRLGMGGGGGAGTGDLSSLVAALPAGGSIPKTAFLKGELVTIVKGDLQGIEAEVSNTREDGKVMVLPKVDGFDEPVDFDNEDLQKVFKVGDHVRAVSGPYAGEIGIVVQVVREHDQCVLISDATKQEIKAFGRDLTCKDVVTTGLEVLGEYQLHDLVQLDQSTAGVIIGIQRDSARVLTSSSTPEQPDIRVVKAADMQRKLKSRNVLATDMTGNQVRCGDYVQFTATGAAGKSGVQKGSVEYVWRNQLFLKGKEFLDSGGFMVCRANKAKVWGAASGSGSNPGIELARAIASSSHHVPQSPSAHGGGGGAGSSRSFHYMPASPSQYASQSMNNGPPQRGALGPPGSFRPPPPRMGGPPPGMFTGASQHATSVNSMVGHSVRVVGGQYNGYKGRVKHETATHAQLELDAISGRIVTVEKRYVRDETAGGARGSNGPMGRAGPHPGSGSQRAEPGYSGSVMAYGSRTPAHPSQTPLHPSHMTPAHYSMTPAHAPYTPMHNAQTPMDDNSYMLYNDEERGQPTAHTPGMGAAYTPGAFTPSAATPGLYGGDGVQTAATPAVDDGPPMMADTPGLAPTPATAATPFLAAPTPAITPGDLTAATPGLDPSLLMTGTTPGLAPTPHASTAFTPNIAATPNLPAATPGLEPAVDDFSLWEGLVVLIKGPGEATSWPQAVVLAVHGPVELKVLRGSFPASGGNFQEDGGAREEVFQAAQVQLLRPTKKDRVKVLHAEQAQHIGRIGHVLGVVAGENADDCIIRLESAQDMCIADLAHVGKLALQSGAEGSGATNG